MDRPSVETDSVSEIVRATTILLIRLHEVTFTPWAKERGSDLMARDVTMQVVIEEVLKGKVRQNVGEPFALKVQQRGTGGFRVMDYYGLWSHVPVQPGARFVAFCAGASDDARMLLTDGQCEQLADPNGVLADTRAALELEAQRLSDTDILAEATRAANQRRDIFARYIWARVQQRAMTSPDIFEALMKILEDPKTTAPARTAYLTCVYDTLGMTASPPEPQEARLIRAMLQLLVLPEAKLLHDEIGAVYLPNILGLDRDTPRHTADEVFNGRAGDRQKILSVLNQGTPAGHTARLRQWLEGTSAKKPRPGN
jgi:hypothetical protein